MAKYALAYKGFGVPATAATVCSLDAGAAINRMAEVIYVEGNGAAATPTDRQIRMQGNFRDQTTAGTSTAQTPQPMDTANANAAKMTGAVNFSAEPTTYDATEALLFGFNTRGGMWWGMPRGEGVLLLGGATKQRFGVRAVADTTGGTIDAILQFWEP